MMPFADLPRRPRQQPAVAEVLAGASGALWVRPFPVNTNGLDQRAASKQVLFEAWRIVNRSGAIEATVDVPVHFRPRVVVDSTVYGIWTNEDGTQWVRSLRVTRR